MKPFLVLVFMMWANILGAQVSGSDYAWIDRRVTNVEASMPDNLAGLLTKPCFTQLDKVRSIYSWITQHIAYNTNIFSSRKHPLLPADPADTLTVWKNADEMVAIRVLYRRVAICDGYARLFKTLCDYAGINAEIITGYARCFSGGKQSFRTNHTWNAVRIDGNWYLLDVTWGSGFINGYNEFVQKTDDFYFLTPPELFIRDHYPEDPRWTLLQHLPNITEFKKTPFRFKSFLKYSINSYLPSRGLIEASVGDTVNIELEVRGSARDKKIASEDFMDEPAWDSLPVAAFLKPTVVNNRFKYSYVVPQEAPEWLDIVYNNDLVLRYKLIVSGNRHKDERERKSTW